MPCPSVSVLVPVFNGQPYLEGALYSVLNQSFRDFELLIADDGSTDSSVGMVLKLDDPRVRILEFKSHQGLFGNLNRLVKAARAPLIHIFCQDDIMEEHCLREEIAFFELYPEIGISFCKKQAIDNEGRINTFEAFKDLPDILLPELSMQHFFYHGCIPGNLSTVCVRKVCVEGAGYFDEELKLSGDYELWARICDDWPLGVIHKPLVRIRAHKGRLSARQDSGVTFIEENNHVRKLLIPMLPSDKQSFARSFECRRHHVLDFHFAVRSLLQGNLKDSLRVLKVMGIRCSLLALWYWVTTGNNRFYRPQAQWVLPEETDLTNSFQNGSEEESEKKSA